MAVIIFWALILIIFYTYFGYPLLLAMVAPIFGRKVDKQEISPEITIIIAAYNEEKDIARKITETLALDYPADKLELIVVSDASTDKTDEIVSSYSDKRVKLLKISPRQGKTHAQNEAVKIARGAILVFSDATTAYQKNVLKKIVNNFADPKVGGVAAELVYVNKGNSNTGEGTGLYWRYEKYLRKKESDLTSLLGVSGCCYAIRKDLYEDINTSLISDFVVAQMIYSQGKRVVFEPEAIVFEETNSEIKDEFKMRVRVATRSLHGLWHMRGLLNPFRHGMFSLQLISHKVLRYLVPVFLLLLFLTNVLIYNIDLLYKVLFIGQCLFYLGAFTGLLGRGKSPFSILTYFFTMNLALFLALINFIRGEKNILWKPVR